jgi:dTDP-glucose 4,6-dehydratase
LILDHGKAGEIYNIGSGMELKNLELVNILLELTGSKKSTINFVKDRLGHDLRYSINNRKIRDMGFELHFELREGLRDLIALEN